MQAQLHMDRKLNKAEAGFHMLHLLSAVDGSFSSKEDAVIRDYLVRTYPFNVNLDKAVDYLSILPHADYILHFQKCMDDFYQDSTEEERNEFLNFAVQLVKADNELTRNENIFLKELFDNWDIDHA